MTRDEAKDLFRKIVGHFGEPTPPQIGDTAIFTLNWLEAFEAFPHHQGVAAVKKVIQTWRGYGFPPIGFFMDAADSISAEGQPNAIPTSPRGPIENADFDLFRLEVLHRMPADEYRHYLAGLREDSSEEAKAFTADVEMNIGEAFERKRAKDAKKRAEVNV